MCDSVCKAHSGFVSDIRTLERNVTNLWSKWDNMQRLLIGTLVSTCLSLIGVIFLLVKTIG